MVNSKCKDLLQALLQHSSEDKHSRVGTLLRSLDANWKQTDDGAIITLVTSNEQEETGKNEREVIPLVCRRCSWVGAESDARAFVTDPPSIVFCQGRCEDSIETILVHELTHVFDMRRLHLNLRDCCDLAYSEIRAANFAECSNIAGDKRQCIRRRAIAATAIALRQHRQEHNAKSCVNEVYDRAINDERPFNK